MKRREFVAGSSAALALGGLVSAPASAQAGFQEGRHYVRLQQPVPVSAPAGKIEVLEFFWYGCPHCNAFEPTLEAWVKKLPADVAFRRVHVAFRTSFEPLQRLYATLENMNLVEALHRKVFYAVHQQGARLDKPGRSSTSSSPTASIAPSSPRCTTPSACRARCARASSSPRPTRSTACRPWAFTAASTPRRRWPAAKSASEIQGQTRALALTDQLVASLRKG